MSAFLASIAPTGWLILGLALVGLLALPRLIRNVWTGTRDREALRAARLADRPDTATPEPGQDSTS